MNVAKLPDLGLPQMGEVEDPSRPILSFDWSADAPDSAAAHAHPRAHVIAVTSGAYWVKTPEGTWLVPEGLAVWLPSMTQHQVYSHSAAAARIFFVDRIVAKRLPSKAGTVVPSDLMTSLMKRMVQNGNDYDPGGPAARLGLVMLDELAQMRFAPTLLPASTEPRLERLIQIFADDPLNASYVRELARQAGASTRTLARLFRSEMGMTLGQWRRNLRLQEAIRRLATGASVTEVALELGYSSPSAFTHMFHQNLGVVPSGYRAPEPTV
jgi:transcriptional regulator GlxA family with amidase domain